MAAEDSPDWLPAGWTVQFNALRSGRQIRYYTNLETGRKCFSKDDVMRCIKMENTDNRNAQPTSMPMQRHLEKNHMQVLVKQNEYPDWLPDGWIMELKTRISGSRMGTKYKCYIDPSTGGKFYSKPEVFRYLKTLKHESQIPEQTKTVVKKLSAGKVVIEECRDENLPPGWIKEIKIKKSGTRIRKDPFYTDPVTGYVFRSRKDVLRYLETGEIGRDAFKSNKGKIDDQALLDDKSSGSSAAKRLKINHPATNQEYTAVDDGSFDSANFVMPEAGDSKKRPSKRLSKDPVDTKETAVDDGTFDSAKFVMPEAGDSKKRRSKRLSKLLLDTKETVDEESGENKETVYASRSVLPEAGGSKKQQGKRVSTENVNECVGSEEIITAMPIRSARPIARGSNGNQSKKRLSKVPLDIKETVVEESDENKETVNVSRSVLPEASGSKKQPGKRVSTENVNKDCAESEEIVTAIRSARPTARGTKGNQSKKDATDDPVSTSEVNILQEDLLASSREKNNHSITQSRKRKPKNKEELNLPRRSSNRLSGIEPVLAVNASNLVDGASKKKLNVGSEGKQPHYTFTNVDTPQRELSNKSKKPLEEQRVCEKQVRQVEAGTKEKGGAESHLSSAFGSDPCLDFTFKTLTGAIPLEDTVDVELISTPVYDILKETDIVEKSRKRKTKFNSRKSMNKEFNIRRLPRGSTGFGQEYQADSSVDQAHIAACRRSYRDLAPDPSPSFTPDSLVYGANWQIKSVSETAMSQHVSTATNTPLRAEPSKQSKRLLEDLNVTLEPLQNLESEKRDNEKADPYSFFSFGDSWSDPCLEFAIKTLTGDIPIETAIQSSFQQQPGTSHRQRGSSDALPDFGSPSFFQNDISSHFDTPEKPSAQPLLPVNTSLPNCSRTGTEQPPCLNKEFHGHGKVKSSKKGG